MKVLLLIDALSSGGAERQMSYLAIYLKKAGHNIRLVTFYDVDCFYEADLVDNDIIVECYPNCRKVIPRIRQIADIVRNWRPDVVVAYKKGASMAACFAKMCIDFPLIVSERNTTQILSFSERIKFWTYSLSDMIVPNSRSQARYIKNHFSFLREKTFVITNMVDVEKFCPLPTHTRNDIPIVLTTARVMAQKNIIVYLNAISIIKHRNVRCHFDWYGNLKGDPKYFEKVRAEIKRLNLEDMITFHEPCHEVQLLYQKADVFCLPSTYEGFPNVICEAMAAGLPIVCSNVCDNPDIVEANVNGLLFSPLAPDDIAEKIIDMLNMRESEKEIMRGNNRSKIVHMCSAEVFIKNMETLFNKLLC